MRLAALLDGVTVRKLFSTMYGRMAPTQDVEVRGIRYDSRAVGAGDLFVAIPGAVLDGHRFVASAIAQGARVVVVESDAAIPDEVFLHAGVMKIVVPDARVALARLAANFHGHPARHLRLVGVTGTNGKTTTTHLVRAALEAGGEAVGLIGTIEHVIGARREPAVHTTPESTEVNGLLADMVAAGCTAAVMEVSSHALAQHRVLGLEFSAAVFTNLTQDHLDYHGSMEEYFRAKKLLFDGLAPGVPAVVNRDDPRGLEIAAGSRGPVLTYGTVEGAGVRAIDIRLSIDGTRFTVLEGNERAEVSTPLAGRFNVANTLAAFTVARALGVPREQALRGIASAPAVRGRFERISGPQGWTAIVDYAHTPDALENCLRTIRDVLPAAGGSRIITVFGCGGNRDSGKRPVMGRIASELSDITIVTSDNPRRESPAAIIDQILAGVPPGRVVERESDRRRAIASALRRARAGDVVLIAGKGHETYQVVGDTKLHFDDREEVEAFLRGVA